MSQFFRYPAGASVTIPAVGTNGATAPTSSIEVGGINPSGNLQPLQTDASGNLKVDLVSADVGPLHVIVDSSALPTGASTSALQTTGNTLLGNIIVDLTNGTQITQITGTVPLPTGAATAANQVTGNNSLASIDGKTPALGQALAAASVPVVLTAAQLSTLTPLTSVTVTQATGTNLHTVVDSGTITVTQATGSNLHVVVDSGSVTANNASVSTTGSAVPASATMVGGSDGTNLRAVKVSATGVVSVDGSAVTQPISAAALPLPTGASTSALQTTGNTSLSSIDTKTPALGQALAAASVPVVLTALQLASISGSPTGRSVANAPARNDYTSVSVTTAAFVQLVASTTSATNMVEVFDSSGQTMALAVGAAASEVIQFYIFPGGNGQVPLSIPAGSRVSIKAISATANVGEIDVNFYT